MSSIPNQFNCFRINQEEEKIVSGLETIGIEDINPGEVTLKTEYSSINYKDALAATGAGKILRKFPLIGGVDARTCNEADSDGGQYAGKAVELSFYQLSKSEFYLILIKASDFFRTA